MSRKPGDCTDPTVPRHGDEQGDEPGDGVMREFLSRQAVKCRAHNRAQTNEVLDLIRKHRKGRDDSE